MGNRLTVCQIPTRELRWGSLSKNQTLKARQLLHMSGLATGIAAAGGFVFVSTTRYLLQFEATRPQVIMRVKNSGYRISMLSPRKLVLTTQTKIRNLLFRGCKVTFPTIYGFRPKTIQIGTHPVISFHALGFSEHVYEKTIQLNGVECYKVDMPLLPEKGSTSCQLAEASWSEQELDMQISFLIAYDTTIEYLFLKAISTRQVSVGSASATEYNEEKAFVDVFGENLEGGVTQTFKMANQSCLLRSEASDHLRFLCLRPDCNENQMYKNDAGRLLIGDWSFDVIVSGIECSAPNALEKSIMASLSILMLVISFVAGVLAFSALRKCKTLAETASMGNEMTRIDPLDSVGLATIPHNSDTPPAANDYEPLHYNEYVTPVNLVYYSDTIVAQN
ncbi:hypothetical protein HDE_00865 [Halotydeus destructor]|nr:hypothetical protein HDE_00865 [Halotydeus destructor]